MSNELALYFAASAAILALFTTIVWRMSVSPVKEAPATISWPESWSPEDGVNDSFYEEEPDISEEIEGASWYDEELQRGWDAYKREGEWD